MGSGLTALWGMNNMLKVKRADSAKHDLIAHTSKTPHLSSLRRRSGGRVPRIPK